MSFAPFRRGADVPVTPLATLPADDKAPGSVVKDGKNCPEMAVLPKR